MAQDRSEYFGRRVTLACALYASMLLLFSSLCGFWGAEGQQAFSIAGVLFVPCLMSWAFIATGLRIPAWTCGLMLFVAASLLGVRLWVG